MADKEKVIKGLREMSCRATWKDIDRIRHKFQPIINDAIAMLKEMEKSNLYKCQNCGTWVSAENVVRCQDCKYCEYPKAEKEWCKKGHLHGNAENWFCADGERKSNGND